MEMTLVIGLVLAVVVWKGLRMVPQQQAWIVERFGKYDRKLEPGLNLLIPIYERVAYKFGLKEMVLDVPEQSVITRDNVPLFIDGVIYVRITDATAAAYGVADPFMAVTQLAQTTMRSEIGKMTMDETFEERERLNANIVTAINEAASTWGIQCLRYELKNINPPTSVVKAMEQQVTAERQKRADILESEGKRQAQINNAEGVKQEVVLRSEAAMTDQINRAKGEAEAILAVAKANADSIALIANAIRQQGGYEAVSYRIAEEYVDAFRQLAQESTTVLLPANAGDAGSMVAQALTVFDSIRDRGGRESLPKPVGRSAVPAVKDGGKK
jgi:regulator of protease activity HflC (stomatin/prohibitin superfamily)